MLRLTLILALMFSLCFSENTERKRDILYTNLIGAAVISVWGVANWDYVKGSPHTDEEKWFGKSTQSGGADKLGHFYSPYFIGSGLSGLYESWGYKEKEAAFYGSLSSLFLMNYMEIGDAFSPDLGFSYEDFIMNTLGAFSSYLFYTNPELSKRIDLRFEYIPSFNTADLVTEYERMKYLIAFKAEGFEFISNPYLKYAELQFGYYTRNYKGGYTDESERIVYMGIGINLSRVLRKNSYKKTAHFLNYYQLPYTYLPFEKDLNR